MLRSWCWPLLPCVLVAVANVTIRADSPTTAPLRIGTQSVGKVLFLGNSITMHGPAPQIGWTGNWGMAASAEEKDYVHRLGEHLTKAAGGKPRILVRNIAEFERGLAQFNIREKLKEELDFQADLVIIAIGENVAPPKSDQDQQIFAQSFARLLAEVSRQHQPTILVRSQFWPDAVKDALMKKATADAQGVFVDVGRLGSDEANFARSERKFEHAGVAAHPGDRGMQALADALWDAIRRRAGVAETVP